MADIIERIRSQDEYREFYELATKIRNQKLLTDAEVGILKFLKVISNTNFNFSAPLSEQTPTRSIG